MPTVLPTTPKEKERVATLAYEGKRFIAFLAILAAEGFTEASTFADWRTIELPSANGYAPYACVIPAGGYDAGSTRYEAGAVAGVDQAFPVVFAPSGASFSFNRVVFGVQTSDGMGGWDDPIYAYSIRVESPTITLFPGQKATYNVQIVNG
jgi:hypothetical protein